VTSAVAVAVIAGAVVLERTDKAPALALGAVHEWCRSGERLPGGSAGGREGEGTSTSHGGRCMEGAGVGGTCLAAVFERRKERAPALVVGAVYGRCGSRRRSPGGSA
jgi:hypothetical protein